MTVANTTAVATKAKKSSKVAKAKKLKAKAKKAVVKHEARDNAQVVSKASEGKLNTDQVRILRVLAAAKAPISRADLKEGVGIGRDGLYSQQWLNGLKNLESRKLIKISIPSETSTSRGFTHAITALGTKLLSNVEKKANA